MSKKTVHWPQFDWYDGAADSDSEETMIERMDLISVWGPILADTHNRTRKLKAIIAKGGEDAITARRLLEHLLGEEEPSNKK